MLSAASDVNRLSMAPNAPRTAAETSMPPRSVKITEGICHCGSPVGIEPRTAAFGRLSARIDATTNAMSGAGAMRFSAAGVNRQITRDTMPTATACQLGSRISFGNTVMALITVSGAG